MLVTVLRQTMIAGESVSAGSTLDLDADAASLLINIGKAIATPAAPVTEEVEAVEPPKPTRSARKSTQPAPIAP